MNQIPRITIKVSVERKNKISARFFIDIDKLVLKFIGKGKGTRICLILEKEKLGERNYNTRF